MKLDFGEVPDPGERYEISDVLGIGVYGKVYLATDSQASKKKVAVKIQKYENETKQDVEEEYRILRDVNGHINLVDFYGVFKKGSQIWFVLELCEGGPVTDLVNGLLAKNRRMAEEHIAYILKETVKALIYLHENNVIHRDIKGSNILLTREGEVKLCDFGLSQKMTKVDQKLCRKLGSPCWMAPELVTANPKKKDAVYDNRVDVWAIGITAIELGEGKAPFQDMHPSRILFQIVRNPPAALQKMSYWSENYHDFINECLVKYYEYRPYAIEIMEHPFLAQIPENNYHLSLEIKTILSDICKQDPLNRPMENIVDGEYLKKSIDAPLEPMYEEDLAALEIITENNILRLLEKRMENGECYSFIGDILLYLYPNERKHIYGEEFHPKYYLKSRSENAPHIYSVADTAYQNAVHHAVPQQIVFSGESGSGKTTNYLHLLDQLFYIGENPNINSKRMKNAIKLIHSLTHASTPTNDYSTRAVLKTNVSYGKTGKLSGASFKVHCLEKWRISTTDMLQSNFHILYYIYDGLVSTNSLEDYKLKSTRDYRYLRIQEKSKSNQPKDDVANNVIKYQKIVSYLEELEFSKDQINVIHSVIAAILNLGEVRFRENDDYLAELENQEAIGNFAELLVVESKKVSWTMTNYCLVHGGNAIRKRNTCVEARDTRDVLANNLYTRLVDYIVSIINNKLSFGKALFGEKYSIKVLDYFGFECFKQNHFSQLLVNCFNEHLHYHFLQRIFSWETMDLKNEAVEYTPINFYNNKDTLNEVLGKPEGVLSIIDDASKKGHGGKYVIEYLKNAVLEVVNENKALRTAARKYNVDKIALKRYVSKYQEDRSITFSPKFTTSQIFLPHEESLLTEYLVTSANLYYGLTPKQTKNINIQENTKIIISGTLEFTISHYTGKVSYNSREMSERNRDFLPTEVTETMRNSQNPIISMFFRNKFDRNGNLYIPLEDPRKSKYSFIKKEYDKNQFSQIKKMRTQATIFRSFCLDLLKELSIGSSSGGTHFIRCIRTDLKRRPHNFQKELIRQQIRALAVVETAKTRQQGYPHRISFPEFLKRYKFLAFAFEENVEATRDNCRLLMVRLKMEGWALGKSKIFLKYYNEEYLSRLYETQVRKIIKIQSILRGFLVKCRLAKEIKDKEKECIEEIKNRRRSSVMTEEEAAEIIQTAYRKSIKRRELSDAFEPLEEADYDFIKPYALKWKNKSIFYVLMRYRAIKLQDFLNFSQQVHLYNLNVFYKTQQIIDGIDLIGVNAKATIAAWLGETNKTVLKLNFRLDEIPFYDTSYLYDPLTNLGNLHKEDSWDSPYQWRETRSKEKTKSYECLQTSENMVNIKYIRDPDEPISDLPSIDDEIEETAKETKEHQSEAEVINENEATEPTATENNSLGTKTIDQNNELYENQESKMPMQNYLEESEHKNLNKETDSTEISLIEQVEPKIEKISLKKIDDLNNGTHEKENDFINTKPANKDFDYIKPISVKSKPSVDPIAELTNIARKDNRINEDDPPFNFQGMLRKTNFRRDSMKSVTRKDSLNSIVRIDSLNNSEERRNSLKDIIEVARKDSLKNTVESARRDSLQDAVEAACKPSVGKNQDPKTITDIITNGNDLEEEPIFSKPISLEILPGLFINGVEVEL